MGVWGEAAGHLCGTAYKGYMTFAFFCMFDNLIQKNDLSHTYSRLLKDTFSFPFP